MSLCLVTGGAGFIGSHLVRRLLALGRPVRVLDDFSTGRRENIAEIESQLDLVVGDICDRDAVQRCVEDAAVVFHIAARASVPRSVENPRDAHEINITGTLNLLLAARDAGVKRFVYSSSSSAYGDTPALPKVETMMPAPLSPDAVSKLAGEHYCACFAHVYGMQTVSLRYFNVFGPRQDPNSDYAAVIPAFVTYMIRGERPTVFGDGEQSRDFCFIDNVVDANIAAADAPNVAGQAVNIACEKRVTLNDILARINEFLGTDVRAEYADVRAGDVRDSLADCSAARQLIGYAPKIMFAEGLRRSIEWYREHAK